MARVTLRFYGALAKYGKRFDVYANTAQEALHIVVSQLSDIKAQFVDRYFQLRVARNDVSEKDLEYYAMRELFDGDVIHVVPRGQGAGGAFNFIAGAALIAFSFTNPLGWAALAVGATTVGTIAFGVGVALMLTGVAGLLVKQPKITTGGTEEDGKNYSFNSLANVTRQGSAIPLCYGKITIGAQVISQGVSSERLNKAPEFVDDGNMSFISRVVRKIVAKDPSGKPYNTPDNDKTYDLIEVQNGR